MQAVFSPEEAMAENAPSVHEDGNLLAYEHLVRGNADDIISKSKHKVTYHYSVPFTEHAFMEPNVPLHFPKTTGYI